MYSILVMLIYILLLILLAGSKLKNTWIIWASFWVGFFIAYYREEISILLNNII